MAEAASLAQGVWALWFQFFGAVFASKGYTLKNVLTNQINKEIKRSTKDVHLTFYREVVQCFGEVSSHNSEVK